jgi:hypothetical protein
MKTYKSFCLYLGRNSLNIYGNKKRASENIVEKNERRN